MTLNKNILITLAFFATIALQAQEHSKAEIKNPNSLNIGFGIGNTVLYDESFSLVRQIGRGPTFFTSFYHIKEKSSHIIENSISLYKFQSDVSNANYALSGENLHERFNYTYLRNKIVRKFILSAGTSFAFDFSQIKPGGLVINNSPLHDFNLQLQLATKVEYPLDLFKKKFKLSYRLNIPFLAYNSRPDYLGFTEFSGKSKYFNESGNFSTIKGNYFYLNHNFQIALNCNRKNSFSIHYNWYYANNKLSNLYQNMNNTFLVTYARILSSN
jgi:hypothetical protein